MAQSTKPYPGVDLNNVWTGTNAFTNGTPNPGMKPLLSDAIRYVSMTGNDSNDGLSWGTAKATIQSAYSSLPNCTPVPSVGFSVTPTAPCGTVHLGTNPTGYNVSSPITINGLMVAIVGEGKPNTTINCIGGITCLTFNNQSPYAFAPTMSVQGGLYNLTLNGDGSANQIGTLCKTCDGGVVHDVRFSNFNGTNAVGFEFLNDASGGITERDDWNNVAFDNCTTGLLMTTTSAPPANTSFGHNAMRNMQWSLNNGQIAWTLSGSAFFYSSYVDGVINAADNNPSDSATAFSINNSANLRGELRISIDNGSALTINTCSGCTQNNFQTWGYGFGNPGFFIVRDSGMFIDVTNPQLGTGLQFQHSETTKWQLGLDGSDGLSFLNASNNAVFNPSQTGLAVSLGLQIFNTGTTCTTSASAGAICTTAAITLPVTEPDTSYRVVCTGKGLSNVPVVIATTNSSASQFTITIAALTAAAASFSSYDCIVGHN